MQLLSINIATPTEISIGNQVVDTGIYKVPTTESVQVGELGIVGDHIADLVHHGGKDQAVYLYSRQDYDWWEKELGRTLPAGQFGENFTLSSFGSDQPRVGDRYQINDLLLEVAFVRIPCSKFGAKMADMGFPKRFSQALRPGLYTRVIKGGSARAGDNVHYIPTSENYPTASEIFSVYLGNGRTNEMIERCLASPMADRMKEHYKLWLT